MKMEVEMFSPYLFWDIDKDTFSLDDHKNFLVQRVLDYGMMSDWKILMNAMGLEKIATIATQLRDLDSKSLSYISTISQIPLNQFRCYTLKQSMPQHWNF